MSTSKVEKYKFLVKQMKKRDDRQAVQIIERIGKSAKMGLPALSSDDELVGRS